MNSLTYKKRRKFYILFILPAFFIYTFSLAGPLIFGTIPSSLFEWNIMKGVHDFIGLENFINLFHDREFLRSRVFTFALARVTVLVSNVLGFLTASVVNDKIYCKSVVRAFFFIPNIISGVMVAMLWTFIFQKVTPAVGQLLNSPAIENFSWFSRGSSAFWAVCIVSVWQGMGFLMILYLTGLQTLPSDVLEASQLDGCIGVSQILRIKLPLLMPTITINLFISIANGFKAFDIIYALTQGGPSKTTQTVALNLYDDAFSKFNMGYACAKSVVLFLIIIFITGIQMGITRKKEVQA